MALEVKNPLPMQETQTVGEIPGLGRPPGGGHGSPLRHSCLRIPWTEEPGGLQSMGLQRVRHDWSDLACSTLFSMWTIHTIRNYSLLIWEKTHYLVCEEFAQLGSRTWLSWQLIIVSATKKQVYRRHIFKQNKFDSHLPLVSLKKKRLILYSELRYSIK